MIEPFRGCLPLRLWQLAMGLVVALLAFTSPARTGDALPEGGRRALLGEARTWGYQLQRPDPARLGKAPHDVLVPQCDRIKTSRVCGDSRSHHATSYPFR